MEPTDINRRAFDEVHRRRSDRRAGLPAIVRATLGDLTKKRVLHLDAGEGTSAAELAAMGAVVTAVVADAELLERAREAWPSILWIHGVPQTLPGELRRRRFDLVYSPEGVLPQLTDLASWATGLVAVLAQNGELLMFEEHPVAECVDRLLRWHADYFGEPGLWRLGQVVGAVGRAGLRIHALEEYPGDAAWRRHDRRLPGSFLLYARR